VIYDASNEEDGDPGFFYDVVLTTIAQQDDSRPLWPSSPSAGFATGVHTDRYIHKDPCCIFLK